MEQEPELIHTVDEICTRLMDLAVRGKYQSGKALSVQVGKVHWRRLATHWFELDQLQRYWRRDYNDALEIMMLGVWISHNPTLDPRRDLQKSSRTNRSWLSRP